MFGYITCILSWKMFIILEIGSSSSTSLESRVSYSQKFLDCSIIHVTKVIYPFKLSNGMYKAAI